MLAKKYQKAWQNDAYLRDQAALTKIRMSKSKEEIVKICESNPSGAVINLAKLITKTRIFKE